MTTVILLKVGLWMGGVLIGLSVGGTLRDRVWRNYARRQHRTPICSGGRFFYVVPEDEYCNLTIRHMGKGQPLPLEDDR